jgi:hypothetical protein
MKFALGMDAVAHESLSLLRQPSEVRDPPVEIPIFVRIMEFAVPPYFSKCHPAYHGMGGNEVFPIQFFFWIEGRGNTNQSGSPEFMHVTIGNGIALML